MVDNLILFIQSIVQGIVQGITEWLPISSTGHLKLLDAVWPMQVSPQFGEAFEVVIQLGSILAVLVLYFQRLNPFSKKKTKPENRRTLQLWAKVIVACIPAGVAGLLIDDWMNGLFETRPIVEVCVIGATLIVYGVIFIVIESLPRKPVIQSTDDMPFLTAFFIGMFQTLALIPGTSRSGSTIIGATLLGTSRTAAAEFSFFSALPLMLGASGLKMLKLFLSGVEVTGPEWAALGVATLVSFLVSLAAIRFLMNFIQKHDFKIFGWYRIAIGIVIFLCVAFVPQIFA